MRKLMGGRTLQKGLCLITTCLFCFFASAATTIATATSAATAAWDTTGTIKGRVITSDNRPGAYVTIQLKGSRKSTTTEEDGTFVIRNVPNGVYEIEVSLIGTTPVSQTVSVKSDQETTVNLQLALSARQLEDVIITGNKTNKYASKQSDYIAKMPLKDLENPQVSTTVTKELMKDQLVTDFQSALQNVAGGAVQQNPDRTIYVMLRGFEGYGLLRNGVSTGQFFDNTDPVNLEKIEILKGPSATLFGTSISSYGGVVNRVTKKPYDAFGGEIGYSGGQWDLSRFTIDINTPVNADKTALLRVNAASHQEGSFQDAGSQSSWIVAPSFSYKVNEKLTFSLDAESSRNHSVPLVESGYWFSNLSANKYSDIRIPYNSSLIGNDVRDNIGTTNVFAGAEYKISDKWVSNTIYAYDLQSRDAYNLVFLNFINDTMLSRSVYATRSGRVTASDLQENFTGKIATGTIKHRLLLGLDYYSYKIDYPYAYFSYDTVNFTKSGTANMSIERINNFVASNPLADYTGNQYTLSAYATDVVNFTDNLIGMAAVRIDHFVDPGPRGYKQNAVSPKFGLIYQPVKNKVSLFANYMNGFQNVPGVDANSRPFKPQQANQWEGGIKMDILSGKLSSTLSYYNILVKNVLRADTANPGQSIQDGSQRSKGFEAEFLATPLPGLNIIAGYGYNDNVYVKPDTSLVGKRPVESPRNTVNGWVSYKVQRGALKGFIFGFGGNYTSQMYSYLDSKNLIPLPAYTILRATIAYDQPKYGIGLRVNNLTGQKYWNANGEAQSPAQVTGTLTFKF